MKTKTEKLLSDRSEALIEAILVKIPGLNKSRRLFICHILVLFLSLPGRRCALNLSRRSGYCEKTFRLHFNQVFDWQAFNAELARQTGHELILALAPTFLPKSGEQTYGKGKFWSGVSGKTMPGLDFLGMSLIDLKTAVYAAKAVKYYSEEKPQKTVISSADIRNRLMNRLMIERFISAFGISANTEINQDKIRDILRQGQIAA